MKKVFTLLTLLLCAVTSSLGATVSDLKTIATDYVFIADNITSNGTVKLTASTLYDGNVIFAPTANSVAANKGSVTFEGGSHLNSLRLKNTQDQLCFKVSGACTITFYTQSHDSRGINVGSAAGGTQYGAQTASTTEWSCNITNAGVVYLSSYGGDFYFAGFKVTFPKIGQPTIGTNPVSAEYNQGAAATALSVSATAANSGALSYQWYKNETNQSVLAGEGATEIDGATNATYTPSTAAVGTTYYFCKVTEAGNANVATTRMAKVVVNLAGFDVTYSLGSETGTEGLLPANESAVTSVTIPVNKTLYKDGYTLTAWNDGSADHALGDVVDLTADVTLTPVFTANGASSYLGHNASTVTWDFQTKNGAPTWQLEGNTGVQVAQTTVGGSSIDVKLDIDATSGKLNNASWNDWAQFNEGTKLTVPVLNGAVVKLFTMNEGSGTTFGGNDANSYASNIHTYTATADGALEVIAGSGLGYVRYISVTYPSETEVLTVSTANTKVGLTQAIINSVDYLAAATNNWSDQTIGDYSGKFYNMSSTDRNLTIKVTGASRFEVYVKNSTPGRTYEVKVGSGDAQTITHGGTGVESSGAFTIADPTAETTITLSGGGSSVYPGYIVFDPTTEIAPAKTYTTYVTSKALDFTGLELKAYVATTASGSTVTMEPVTTVPANTPLVLKKGSADSYDVPVIASVDAPATNLLRAGDGTTNVGGAGKYDYILSNGVFYHASPAGPVAVGKAYLQLDSAPARELSMSFEDEEVTGVNGVSGQKEEVRGEYFNLAGQRVANPTKGLYIVNGKKVILK